MSSRVALITGGNRGIGLATARELATRGYRVAVTYRNEPPKTLLDDFPDRTLATKCEITDSDSIDAAFSEVESIWGSVEVLIPNAGITRDGLLLRMSEADWDDVIATNLTGPKRCVQRALKGMSKGRFGRIVFLSSVVGLMGSAGQANYAATKAGLIGFARAITREYAARGITANLVAPGPVQTEMLEAVSESAMQKMLDAVPAGRAAQPEEVAAAIAFLASDEAGYVNGQVLAIDGGMSTGH